MHPSSYYPNIGNSKWWQLIIAAPCLAVITANKTYARFWLITIKSVCRYRIALLLGKPTVLSVGWRYRRDTHSLRRLKCQLLSLASTLLFSDSATRWQTRSLQAPVLAIHWYLVIFCTTLSTIALCAVLLNGLGQKCDRLSATLMAVSVICVTTIWPVRIAINAVKCRRSGGGWCSALVTRHIELPLILCYVRKATPWYCICSQHLWCWLGPFELAGRPWPKQISLKKQLRALC